MSRSIILKTLGTNIRNARKASGLTQRELAEKMEVSKSTIEKWEGGVCELSLSKKIRLENILKCECLILEFCGSGCKERI